MNRLFSITTVSLSLLVTMIFASLVSAQTGMTAEFDTSGSKPRAIYTLGECKIVIYGDPPTLTINGRSKANEGIKNLCNDLFAKAPTHVREQLGGYLSTQTPLSTKASDVLSSVFQYTELSFLWLHNTGNENTKNALMLTTVPNSQARKAALGMETRYNTPDMALNDNSWHKVGILSIIIDGDNATVVTSESYYWESNARLRDNKREEQQVYKLTLRNGRWLVDYNARV